MAHNRYALIVAGGSGTRMGSSIPKQFMLLKKKPVLMHTIEAFAGLPDLQVIVVLPQQQEKIWEDLCRQMEFRVPHKLVSGGDTRFHSVRNGLAHVPSNALVAIHDGVRPMIRPETIERSFKTAAELGNAVVAVKLKDSIRELTLTGKTKNANRNNYYLVQTPQTFKAHQIKISYEIATHFNFTDDAGVLEESGGSINLIEGDYKNIKITTPEDLLIAEVLLAL